VTVISFITFPNAVCVAQIKNKLHSQDCVKHITPLHFVNLFYWFPLTHSIASVFLSFQISHSTAVLQTVSYN